MSKGSHHPGLAHDLEVLAMAMHRRQLLRLTFGGGALALVGCSDDGSGSLDESSGGSSGSTGGDTPTTSSGESGGSSTSGDATTGDPACSEIPDETAGPYPGDGTNGANALALAGVVRSDIRASIGGAAGVAEGVPLRVVLTLVDESCTPLAGRAIYIWHCDRAADYSMYTGAATSENYLRGVQETDSDGVVIFQSIFPACYSGRWPHIHFEVYPSLAAATDGSLDVKTSQLALPKAQCEEVFATAGYEQSVNNLAQLTLDSDMVFADGSALQVAEIEGDVAGGYTIYLTVAIKG